MIQRANSSVLIEKISEKLQTEIKKPEWASFAKTGAFKERPPVDSNWWFMRAASILRKVYLKGPIGVSKLSTTYGGRKNRGYKPEKFYPGSTNIIRTILQELEKAGYIKQDKKGVHKGRVAAPKTISLFSQTEKEILKKEKKELPKKQPKEPAKKSEEPKKEKAEASEKKKEDKK